MPARNISVQKIDDTHVEVTETITTENKTTHTIRDLRSIRASLEKAKQDTIDQANLAAQEFDRKIAAIDDKIAQARAQGVIDEDEQPDT